MRSFPAASPEPQGSILPGDWLPGGEELTPTMKLKRVPISAKYEAEIDAMYA
jgi:long-chain acyl-CoA synthetase